MPTRTVTDTITEGLDELALQRTVAIFQALAHPVRLLVLHELAAHGELCAGELQRRAGIEQSAMSHQLRILRHANLVRGVRCGRHKHYRLADRHVAHIVEDALAHAGEVAGG